MNRWIRLLVIGVMLLYAGFVCAQTLTQQSPQRLDAATFAINAHAAGTITITPPASNYVYVTGMDVSDCAYAATTPATPTLLTTGGLNGAPQFSVGSGATAGLCQPTALYAWTTPLKSSVAGQAVTFVVPAFVTGQFLNVNVYGYYNPL